MSERKCVFCGKTKLSREHIFAQWLLKELDIYDDDVTMSHNSFIGAPISNRKHSFSNLVNGLVCEDCNNGWMSQLEDDCKEHIINLMNMNDIKSELKFLEEHSYIIAKWAFKNVILLNSSTNYRKIVPDKHYTALYEGSIPEGVFIDLAFCKSESELEWRQTIGGLVRMDIGIPFDRNKERYLITFKIKNLLIKVVFYKSLDKVHYEDEGAIRIFPQLGAYGNFKLFDGIDDFDLHGVIHEYK